MMLPISSAKREACDDCHRRKVRCDGDTAPGNVCSECSKLNLQCTRIIAKKKRGPKPRHPQAPLEPIQSLISAILAAPTTYRVPTSTHVVRGMLVDLASYSQALEKELASLRSMNSLPSESAVSSSSLITSREVPPSSNEVNPVDAPGDRLQDFSSEHSQSRHFGKFSHLKLLQTALDVQDDHNGGHNERISVNVKRSEFWDLKPWHITPPYESKIYEYPPDDLLESLLALYWVHFHPFYPLLHRPTFEESLDAKLHLYDHTFGSTILAVCALGSRYSDDPRVLYGGATSKQSAGWKYFNQIEFVLRKFVDSPSVYVLQVYSLSVIFMLATHMFEASWMLIGPGIRLAQMIGVHRSGFSKGRNPKEVELWKRAFWQLVILDTASSMALGRPRSCSTNELDLELPAMCDDEYWEAPNPDDAFKQPKNTPSKLTFWIHYIKLMEIVGFAQHSIYSARRLDPWGPTTLSTAEWNQKAVMELDSALNKWIDALPDFLKYYNLHQKDTVFAHQSVMLYAGFYWARIQVHKRFMSWPGQKSILTFPSLAICVNAARSCVHLIDWHHRIYKIRLAPLIPPIFSCAIVLLINLWLGIQCQIALNATKEMNQIQKCLDILALYEDRLEIAGRLRDILLSVISISQLPSIENLLSFKRTSLHEEDSFHVNSIENESTSQTNAGFQQTSQLQYNPSNEASFASPFDANLGLNTDWSLPVTVNDLSEIPVHIDIGSDVVAPFDSVPYGSQNTLDTYLPSHGLDRLVYQSSQGQFTNSTTSSSQIEWSRFMAEVDELLRSVGYPVAGQL